MCCVYSVEIAGLLPKNLNFDEPQSNSEVFEKIILFKS